MIKLFKATDKTYSTNGDVVLETAKARVHKEDNGDFYIDVEAPLKENKKEASYDEGQTIEGTDFSINVDLFKQNELTTIKGNTTQASTPTPDNPVPVNVVSGGQEVEVCGKNLFDNAKIEIGKAWHGGRNNQRARYYIKYIPNENYTITLKSIPSEINSISVVESSSSYDSTGLKFVENITGETTYTHQFNADAIYLILQFGIPSGTFTQELANSIQIQIEKGNQASSFEEYRGNDYLIDLGIGENIFDAGNTQAYKRYSNTILTIEDNDITIGNRRTDGNAFVWWNIPVDSSKEIRISYSKMEEVVQNASDIVQYNFSNTPITSYSSSTIGNTTQINKDNKSVRVMPTGSYLILILRTSNYSSSTGAGEYTISNLKVEYTDTSIELCKINDYQDFIRKGTGKNINSSVLEVGSISNGENIENYSTVRTQDYIEVKPNTNYAFSINGTLNRVVVSLYDINKNYIPTEVSDGLVSTTGLFTTFANAYYIRYRAYNADKNSFLTGKIQLEEGNQATLYEPYGYKNKWYLYKTIGKFTYNNEGSVSTPATNYYNISGLTNQGWNLTVNSSNYISTEYPSASIQNTDANFRNITANMDYAFGLHVGGTGIRFKDIRGLTASQFKADLIGTTIYFALANPTTTEITDSELISQLEGIELLQGLNNVSVSSGDLPGIITIHYDYVNGYNTSIKYIDYLVPNNIIVANTPQGEQAFRISNVENTRTKIKIKAYHVFYDTKNLLIEDSYVVDKNCNDALDHLNNATSDTSPFTTISNINTIANYRCVRKSLYEAIQVVLDRWGGHLVRNNWTIGIYDTIGQDNGVTIRYAKNLKNITATYIWDDVVTKLLPVGKDGLLLNAIDPNASIYVESAMQYDIPYTKTISFSQNSIVEDDYKDEGGTLDEDAYKQALVDDLYAQAIEYINNNYLPKVNYNLSANVEKVSDIGDTIEVIDEKLGINVMTHIISYDYDCILDKYTELQFGNFTPQLNSLLQTINDNTEKIVQEENNTLAITLGRELDEATSKIWGALGNSYVIYDGDKILVVDSLPKETATNVIMINNGGIGFSNTGITGTFNSAWTIDNVLNMEQINVINLTADLIKGGTLKLGSNLNQNGKIEVFDEANNLIAELNKNGLKMYGVDGSYVLMNNQVGFAGYDRNNNKIYWVDKDEFHMKKSVVEEEITLVGKMRIIPITIRNGNTIVNDGIGFINVAS